MQKRICKIEWKRNGLWEFVIELSEKTPYPEQLIYLTKEKYFDGTFFHRVCMILLFKGAIRTMAFRKKKTHRQIPTPPDTRNGLRHHRGAISMPTVKLKIHIDSLPLMSFYCTTISGAYHLDGKYTVFGYVVEGMDIVDKINRVPIDKKWPKDNIRMKVSIIEWLQWLESQVLCLFGRLKPIAFDWPVKWKTTTSSPLSSIPTLVNQWLYHQRYPFEPNPSILCLFAWKTNSAFAFFEKLALVPITSIETGFCSSISRISSAPVIEFSSHALHSPKQRTKGFWLIHRNLTEASTLSSFISEILIPRKTSGNLKSVNTEWIVCDFHTQR